MTRGADPEQRFDHLAQHDALTDDVTVALADQLAARHPAATPCPDVAGAAPLRAILDKGLGELAEPADTVARVARESRAALDEAAALLDRRAAQGKVRRGHGDAVDVLYDLAALVIDLLHRDRRDRANRLLNRYLESRDELDGVPALGVLLALRAIVRATIDADQAVACLALARACLAPGAPRLVALGGLSGSGKTTVARALAPALGRPPGALVLRSDVIRKQLAGVAPETRLDAAAYGRVAAAAVYGEMRRRAAPLLAAGYSVVLDAVHARADERAAATDIARRLGVPFTGLWLRAAPATLVDRVAGRMGDASDATPAVIEQQLGYDTGVIDWPSVDSGAGLDAVLVAARAIVADASGTG